MNKLKFTYTITFGDVAENHVGMQKIGKLHSYGYSVKKLKNVMKELKEKNFEVEYIDLTYNNEDAGVLVIRKGIQSIFQKDNIEDIIKEHGELPMDTKALMKGKVVNKVARYNLCFDDISQEPNYIEGKGRIISYLDVPLTKRVREVVSEWMEEESESLKAEANYYYNIEKCGIGFHGDSERRKVIAFRLGESLPLCFQWFQKSNSVSNRMEIVLNNGDIYIMSEKAVGNDWKKKIIPTLRHSTGCNKYIIYKKPVKTQKLKSVI
jgi:hypothetical protein